MRVTRWKPAVGVMLVCAVIAAGAATSRPARSRQAGGYSPSFKVAGTVARPAVYTLDALRVLPSVIVAHRCVSETTHKVQDHSYRGVPLWSLIAEARPVDASGEPLDSLVSYLVATASDGFPTIIALAEIDPELNGRRVIVAYERDGELLDESRDMAMLVVPEDASCAREIFWLARLEVRSVDGP